MEKSREEMETTGEKEEVVEVAVEMEEEEPEEQKEQESGMD